MRLTISKRFLSIRSPYIKSVTKSVAKSIRKSESMDQVSQVICAVPWIHDVLSFSKSRFVRSTPRDIVPRVNCVRSVSHKYVSPWPHHTRSMLIKVPNYVRLLTCGKRSSANLG